ncbi:MAG: hypothetical protein ABI914_00735 [Acidobacteriota bacterium]
MIEEGGLERSGWRERASAFPDLSTGIRWPRLRGIGQETCRADA